MFWTVEAGDASRAQGALTGHAPAASLARRLSVARWATLATAILSGVLCLIVAGPLSAGLLVATLGTLALLLAQQPGCAEAISHRFATDDETRSLLVAATEHTDELISIVAADGRMTHANPAFCRAIGLDRSAVLRMHVRDFLGEQSLTSIGVIDEAVRADGSWRGTLVRVRQDTTTFLSSATVTALPGDSGTFTHVVVVERDVTRETELREQLTHNERLAAAGQLVSGVAHELNNPLQSIIGFTELLIEAERREAVKGDLEQVRREALRAAKIVRNLLAFVRRSAVERTSVSLNDVVRATVDLRRYELEMSNITLHEHYGEDLPPVMVNREEIQQVLLNLLLNAEQAMRQVADRGDLTIRTVATAEGVVVEVQDSGPGVPAAAAARIFEPFYSTKEVGKGTGLGLSIALGIAQAHGGTLTLVRTDAGACFRLTLPPGEKTTARVGHPEPESSSWSAVSGRRALVADDEVPLRKLLQRLLTRRGFAVDLAEDGMQAANLIEQNRYDVVLCDVQMPRMSGTALYESVQRRQPGVAASFIMVSGDILNDALESFVARAQIPLLSKPFGAKTLDAALEQVMTKRVHRS